MTFLVCCWCCEAAMVQADVTFSQLYLMYIQRIWQVLLVMTWDDLCSSLLNTL